MNRLSEEIITKEKWVTILNHLTNGRSVLVYGDVGAGKTEFLKVLEEELTSKYKTVVVGEEKEYGVTGEKVRGVKVVTKVGSVFEPYGTEKVAISDIINENPDFLLYDEVKTPVDVLNVIKAWSVGVGVVATVTASNVYQTVSKIQDLGKKKHSLYTMGMEDYMSVYSLVIKVEGGWGGNQWSVADVYNTQSLTLNYMFDR